MLSQGYDQLLVILGATSSPDYASWDGSAMQDEEAQRLCLERLNVVPDWILETDTRGVITYSNRVVEDLLGVRAEEIVGLQVFDLVAAPDDKKCRRCFAKAQDLTTPPGNTIVYFRDSAGGTKPLALRCVPILPGDTLPEGVRVVARDISDIESMHKAAREVSANYRSVLENSPIGIVIIQNEQPVYANPTIMTMLGYTIEDAEHADIWQFVHPEDIDRVRAFYRQRMAGEHPPEQYEIRVLTKSGEVRHFELRATLIAYNGGPAVLDSVVDVTDRKQAEQALAETEAKYRTLAEESLVGTCIIQDGHFVYVNRRLAEILGYTPEELVTGITIDDTTAPEDRSTVSEDFRVLFSGAVPSTRHTFKVVRKNGEMCDVEALGVRTEFQGRPAIMGSLLDITDRKRAENALAEAEKKYRTLVERTPVGIHIIQDRRFVYANPRFAEILGYSPSEVLSMDPFADVVHPDDLPEASEAFQTMVESGAVQTHAFRIIRKDRSIAHVEAYGTPTTFQGRPAVFASMLDVTDRARAEAEVLHRMELEKVLVDLSTGFINFPSEDIDILIDRALRVIGKFIGADRGYVFILSDDRTMVRVSHEWCDEGVSPETVDITRLPFGDYPMIAEGLAGREAVQIPSVDNLPDEHASLRALLQRGGAKSVIALPMILREEAIGFLEFETIRAERSWPEETVTLLRILGEILVNALEHKRAHDALQARTAELEAVFDAFADLYFWLDSGGRIVDYRASAEGGLYVPPREFIGKKMSDVLPPDVAGRIETALAQAHQTGAPAALEYMLPLPGGNHFYEGRIVPLPGALTMAIIRDVTERRRSEEALRGSEELLSRSFDAIQDGISVLDADLNIVRVNAKMEEWYSHQLPLVGKKCYEVYHGRREPCEVCPTRVAIRDRIPHMEVVPLVGPEGAAGWQEVYSHPMIDAEGRCTGVVEYVRDITRRVQTEERLKKLTETMLSFGPDPINNISSLVALVGELTGAAFAAYNRLQDGLIKTWAGWQLPEDYIRESRPEGRICYDVIKKRSAEPYVVRDLPASVYAQRTHLISNYGLQTYVGEAVPFGDEYVGHALRVLPARLCPVRRGCTIV